jgi:DNA-binding transcriptional ArsR family regulator
MDAKKYESVAEKLKVLAHPIRLCIVKGLYERERGVNEMCDCLNAPQPTISLHLTKMKAAGIVEGERQGNNMIYRIKDENTAKLIIELLNNL